MEKYAWVLLHKARVAFVRETTDCEFVTFMARQRPRVYTDPVSCFREMDRMEAQPDRYSDVDYDLVVLGDMEAHEFARANRYSFWGKLPARG